MKISINKIIIVLILGFLFSIFQIFNLKALYKDQVEMMAFLAKNVDNNYCFELIEKASNITSYISFFQYLSITIGISIVYLLWKK